MGIDSSDAWPLGTMNKDVTELTDEELRSELAECVHNMPRWFPINTPGKLDAMRVSLRYIKQDLLEIERRLGREAMCRLGYYITEQRPNEFSVEAKEEGNRRTLEMEKTLTEDFPSADEP
jgi:hypothetical protein